MRHRLLLALASASIVMAGAGCSSSASSSPTTAKRATPGNPDPAALFAKRYCEVLVVKATAQGPVAHVWNTYPLNLCPPAKWARLDTAAIAKEQGGILALANGPRYWLMDSIATSTITAHPKATFAGMGMYEDATLQLHSLSTAPYVAHEVDRHTQFTFDKGRRIYELTDAQGQRWVMQSWSQQVDPSLGLGQLAGLGSRLKLPAGWSYSSRVLTKPLQVVTRTSSAHVLQDDLKDSYSLEAS